jgi:hypothetical protein
VAILEGLPKTTTTTTSLSSALTLVIALAAFGCQNAAAPPETRGGTGGENRNSGGSAGNNARGGAGASGDGTGGSVGNNATGGAGMDTSSGDAATSDAASADSARLPAGARPLTANDVSVLFPRFGNEAPKQLWRPTLTGKGGAFLAASDVERLAKVTGTGNLLGPVPRLAPAQEFELLRVVAVRFDPCFAGTPCQAQIRLVLQGFLEQGAALDGAVHLLHNLTQSEFREVLAELRAMTALAPENRSDLPLSPSPALLAQGMEGAYGKALRALVTRYAGAANLARVTFMTRSPSAQGTWEFGGFDYGGGEPRPLVISGLPANTTRQSVSAPVIAWGYFLSPKPVHLAAAVPVISSTEADKASPAAIDEGYSTLLSVSNPLREHAESADCGTCHVANHLRAQVERNFKVTPPTTGYMNERQAPRALGMAEMDRNNLRAFGYFDGFQGPSVAISQRVANETHHVLQLLEQF